MQLGRERLIHRYWRFSHDGGPAQTEVFRFMPDGKVGGYDHFNERYWRLTEGVVSLLDGDGSPSVHFAAAVDGDRTSTIPASSFGWRSAARRGPG